MTFNYFLYLQFVVVAVQFDYSSTLDSIYTSVQYCINKSSKSHYLLDLWQILFFQCLRIDSRELVHKHWLYNLNVSEQNNQVPYI